MKYEKSCGTIILKDNNILMIEQKMGCVGFPKGHMKNNETEVETAIRETMEETGLDVKVDASNRFSLTYLKEENITKTVIYFLASLTNENSIKIQTTELNKAFWVPKDKVLEHLSYDNMKFVWLDVQSVLNKK